MKDRTGRTICKQCKAWRLDEDFYGTREPEKKLTRCKRCRDYHEAYVKRTHQGQIQRDNHRKRTFGITKDEYAKLLESQDHKCGICRRPKAETLAFAVDHNHETGANRGLLCRACNMGLGQFGDSIERLEAALAYLRKYS